MTNTFPLGSVSSDTHSVSDLIIAFSRALDPNSDLAARAWEFEQNGASDEEANQLLGDMFDALSEAAPQYCYFGAHIGDGTDFGFWVNWESIEEDLAKGQLLEVSDLAEIPASHNGLALLSSNGDTDATLYSVENGVASEVWNTV